MGVLNQYIDGVNYVNVRELLGVDFLGPTGGMTARCVVCNKGCTDQVNTDPDCGGLFEVRTLGDARFGLSAGFAGLEENHWYLGGGCRAKINKNLAELNLELAL